MYFLDEDISDRWEKATEKFYLEFGIAPSEIQLLRLIKILFIHYINEYKLSETASVALYFHLAIYSMIITTKKLKINGSEVPEKKLSELVSIFEKSKQLAREAGDWEVLDTAIRGIIDAINAMLIDLRY